MENTTAAVIAASVAALAALVTAIMNFYQIKGLNKTFKSELFSKLLDELGDKDARENRGIILSIKEDNELKRIAEEAKDKGYKDLNKEMAAFDITIPRLDRVGFFVIGDESDLLLKYPPAWLWEIVEKMWDKSKYWIETRREGTHDRHYGRYFERLHIYYENNKNTLDKVYKEADSYIQDC
jgi:hypothetical protein